MGADHWARYGASLGVLVKLIDAGERLTVQVHPDRETAEKLFHSRYGKTECWYVLGGRTINGEEPCIYLGFRPGVTRSQWKQLFREQNCAGMLACLHKIPVHRGEVILIRGGVPHAIGAGCFLTEIQEPTDYTIRVERTTPSGLRIADSACLGGHPDRRRRGKFPPSPAALPRAALNPSVIRQGPPSVRPLLFCALLDNPFAPR